MREINLEKIPLILSWLLLAVFAYVVVFQPLFGLPELEGSREITALSLTIFCLVHGAYFIGKKKIVVFFFISAIISWIMEQVAVTTGIIGNYHYTDALGPMVGAVPVKIILAWFMMIYPSYIMSDIIVGKGSGIRKVVFTALLGAMIVSAWDLAIDPLLSSPLGNTWVWEDGGEYFGVPYMNHLGWILTSFIIYLIYGFYGRGSVRKDSGVPVVIAPVVAYMLMMMRHIIRPYPPEIAVIVVFAMGIPVLIALMKVVQGYPPDEST